MLKCFVAFLFSCVSYSYRDTYRYYRYTNYLLYSDNTDYDNILSKKINSIFFLSFES